MEVYTIFCEEFILLIIIILESGPAEGVVISGLTVDTSVTFTPISPLSTIFDIEIDDDEYGLENPEMYRLDFTSSTPSEGVILGRETNITIIDDDSKLYSYLYPSY